MAVKVSKLTLAVYVCAVQGIYEMINRVASKKCNSGKKVHVIVFNVMNFK